MSSGGAARPSDAAWVAEKNEEAACARAGGVTGAPPRCRRPGDEADRPTLTHAPLPPFAPPGTPNTKPSNTRQWDKVENKTGFVLYSAGAFLAIWFSSNLVTALNSIPLLPKFMELVGLGYSSWFGELDRRAREQPERAGSDVSSAGRTNARGATRAPFPPFPVASVSSACA